MVEAGGGISSSPDMGSDTFELEFGNGWTVGAPTASNLPLIFALGVVAFMVWKG